MSQRAFHFVRLNNGVPKLRDGRPVPPVGEWLAEDGELEICARGLHASRRAIDALKYLEWANAAVCVVECDDIVTEQEDKFVCRRRMLLGWAPCDDLLRLFARKCALSVAHLWDMPVLVREYLETGNEDLRRAASDAARYAARYAASNADWYAARYAASDAARYAAMYAACNAAWYAASDAARYAACNAAWYSAIDAAWYAARYAAWYAARCNDASDAASNAAWYADRCAASDAASDLARYAARDAQNAMLESLIVDACGIEL